jgi:hypothetical protein
MRSTAASQVNVGVVLQLFADKEPAHIIDYRDIFDEAFSRRARLRRVAAVKYTVLTCIILLGVICCILSYSEIGIADVRLAKHFCAYGRGFVADRVFSPIHWAYIWNLISTRVPRLTRAVTLTLREMCAEMQRVFFWE